MAKDIRIIERHLDADSEYADMGSEYVVLWIGGERRFASLKGAEAWAATL